VAAVEAAARGAGDAVGALVPGAPVARLIAPAIALDEIVVEGIGERELAAGPGHYPGSALPGARGNAVVSAHRDRHFHALDELALGDTVVTETAGERVTWRIVERRVVRAGVPALRRSDSPVLTLTTCWPVRWVGPAPERLLLTAEPVTRAARG
jgi:sortase A